MQPENVAVDLRLAQKADSKLKAFADIAIDLGESGEINVFGLSVIGDPARVVPPARKGEHRWFDVATFSGQVKRIVYAQIAKAYEEALAKQKAGAA